MPSILLPWIETLGLRHQGVLMSAIRGCDVAVRHDPSKIAQRILRGALLIPHAGRFANPRTYIWQIEDETEWEAAMQPFANSFDHYPNHYVWHFIHAAEIIGYCGPDEHPVWPCRWLKFYEAMCHRMHVNVEMSWEMDDRLNMDEVNFHKKQQETGGVATTNEGLMK